jgi:hypothetical protein
MEEGMSKIDRRNMLKIMAATAGGAAAAAGSGLLTPVTGLAASIPRLDTPSGTNNNSSAPSLVNGPKIAATPGVLYRNFGGIDFKTRGSATTYADIGSGIYQTASSDYMPAKLDLPHLSIITEASVWVANGVAGTTQVYLTHFNADGTNYVDYANASTSTVSGVAQRLDLAFAPLIVDTTSTSYVIFWRPGALVSSDILYGARVGYINAPGMTLFPNPRRVVDGFATPFTSGITYGPFDATHQVYPTSAPSGVPAGATAAFCAVQSYSSGVLTIFPDLTTDPNVANFSAVVDGPLNLTYMMVPLSPAGKFKIDSHITGRVFVDVWGYVFPPG